ncbi:hypothetical protein BJ138DRAFT_1153113 [Hygrophoropsis aurantiaca]|uniref:Uncharacterized protein n=1 Tax=Hygrophoropsis aurantiaca TaxID=72124 RepID=A0ACB8AA29_9AGAM|nr:hypothetical protein BJ138DRAFT_1153113 [Hygrophoropsis aurantiaca]
MSLTSPSPRPLSLNTATFDAPSTPVNTAPSRNATKAKRRQSSIAYFSSAHDSNGIYTRGTTSVPTTPGALSVANSNAPGAGDKERKRMSMSVYEGRNAWVGQGPSEKEWGRKWGRGVELDHEDEREQRKATEQEAKRESTSSDGLVPRAPLTITEKHADLLHFIAQKEAKCLELRSLLTMHEAELAQLKRQWERIINRGFAREQEGNAHGYAAALDLPGSNKVASPSTRVSVGGGTNGQGPAMLDGLKDGVHEVGRLIVAGLSDLSSSPLPASPSPNGTRTTVSSVPRTPISIITRTPSSSITRTPSSSVTRTSSSSFARTSLSGSSASSIWEETESGMDGNADAKEKDTNADLTSASTTGGQTSLADIPSTSRACRRRSRDCSKLASPLEAQSRSLAHQSSRHAAAPSVSRSTSIDIGEASPLSDLSNKSLDLDPPSTSSHSSAANKTQRISAKSANAPAFPPPSSMPGLGSLAIPLPSASSWVDSVGKKWGEIQRGETFTKNQKRASVLFADMSQSLAAALAPPSPSPVISSCPGANSGAPSTPSASASWLDDDDDGGEETIRASIMIPSKAAPASTPTTNKSAPTGTTSVDKLATTTNKSDDAEDDDEDWNW